MKVYKLFHLASFVHNIYLTSYLSKPYEAIRYINNNAWYIYIYLWYAFDVFACVLGYLFFGILYV